jgi:hypothetical protein
MKSVMMLTVCLCGMVVLYGQKTYPEPEFTREVYYLKKDSVHSVVRLEKDNSEMESKTKMGGFGGAESGYSMDGEKSPVRLAGGNNLSFVLSTGASAGKASPQVDSMMRANGLDPAMGQNMGGMGMDPVSMISLYKAESGKNKRKIIMQKTPGAMPFGSKKIKTGGDKYTFSVKKIREGYWELVVDKTLTKGEYIFTMLDVTSMGAGGNNSILFAFAID